MQSHIQQAVNKLGIQKRSMKYWIPVLYETVATKITHRILLVPALWLLREILVKKIDTIVLANQNIASAYDLPNT